MQGQLQYIRLQRLLVAQLARASQEKAIKACLHLAIVPIDVSDLEASPPTFDHVIHIIVAIEFDWARMGLLEQVFPHHLHRTAAQAWH